MKNFTLFLLLSLAGTGQLARAAGESYPLNPYASFAVSASKGEICEALSWVASKFRKTPFSRLAYNKMSISVQREFPLTHPQSRQRPSIQRRFRYFMAMLKFSRFTSPEDLIAATDHFLGNKEFSFGRWLGNGEDVFIDDSPELATRRSFLKLKTSLFIEEQLPTNEEEYAAWLISLLQGAHLHVLNRELNSVSTIPFVKNGSLPWGENSYRNQVEAKTRAVDRSFYAFLDRVARVMPEIRAQLPAPTEQGSISRAWSQARLFIWPKPPWKWLRQNTLNTDHEESWVPWGHYFMRWLSENTLRIGIVASAISSISFATYVYQNFSFQDLRDIQDGKEPAYVTEMIKDQSDIQDDYAQRHEASLTKKQKEIATLKMEIAELEARLKNNTSASTTETEASLRQKRSRLKYLERY